FFDLVGHFDVIVVDDDPRSASFFTLETIRLGVSIGPDRNDRTSVCPLARIFTEVPPTSMTSTFLPEGPLASPSLIKDPSAASGRPCRVLERLRVAIGDDLTLIAPAHPLEHGGLGFDHVHQLPRTDQRPSASSAGLH